jgi:hypothetical protein
VTLLFERGGWKVVKVLDDLTLYLQTHYNINTV